VPAGMNLLDDELRFDTVERFQFLRSARRIQYSRTTPSDPDQVSVSAARAGTEHAILCHPTDVGEVRRIAQLAGSHPLVSHDGWPGRTPGLRRAVGLHPRKARLLRLSSLRCEPSIPESAFYQSVRRPPDPTKMFRPGASTAYFDRRSFQRNVRHHWPAKTAQQAESGDWTAPGWDTPGRHIIDIVPGPR
jgi:hypothetical protein